MGFSLSKIVSKVDKFTGGALGVATAGLLPGTIANDLLMKSGLLPGEGPDLSNVANEAEAKEKIALFKEEQKRKEEAKFLATEGQGARRTSDVSFGNEQRLSLLEKDERTARATGRFDQNRLVL